MVNLIVNDKNNNCFENIISTVSLQWNRNFELLNWCSWGFSYVAPYPRETSSLGERIGVGYAPDWMDCYALYTGVVLKNHQTEDLADIKFAVSEETKQKKPIMISSTLYWCKWTKGYRKHDIQYFFLVIDQDDDGNWYVQDPSNIATPIIVSPEELKGGLFGYATFQCNDISQCSEDWDALIHKSIYNSKIGIENMYNFNKEVQFLDVALEKNKYKEENYTPFLNRINDVSRSRLKYINFLSKFSKLSGLQIYEFMHETLENLSTEWMRLFNMYTKLFIQYSSRLFNSCNTLLSSIIQHENEACVKIETFITKNTLN